MVENLTQKGERRPHLQAEQHVSPSNKAAAAAARGLTDNNPHKTLFAFFPIPDKISFR
jgi:hypothetical protein